MFMSLESGGVLKRVFFFCFRMHFELSSHSHMCELCVMLCASICHQNGQSACDRCAVDVLIKWFGKQQQYSLRIP